MTLSKADEAQFRATLAMGREETFGIALESLLEHELERVKNLAITPGAVDVAVAQGEATAYKKFLKYLKERPLPAK